VKALSNVKGGLHLSWRSGCQLNAAEANSMKKAIKPLRRKLAEEGLQLSYLNAAGSLLMKWQLCSSGVRESSFGNLNESG
jgi:hypothetical protein